MDGQEGGMCVVAYQPDDVSTSCQHLAKCDVCTFRCLGIAALNALYYLKVGNQVVQWRCVAANLVWACISGGGTIAHACMV